MRQVDGLWVISASLLCLVAGSFYTVRIMRPIIEKQWSEIKARNEEIAKLKGPSVRGGMAVAMGSIDIGNGFSVSTGNDIVSGPVKLIHKPRSAGYLDAADCTGIGGWSTGPVDIYDYTRPIALNLPADQYRSDVGRKAFSIPTPKHLIDGKQHRIYTFHAGTQKPLVGSGKTFSCVISDPPTAFGGDSNFEWAREVLVRQRDGTWKAISIGEKP